MTTADHTIGAAQGRFLPVTIVPHTHWDREWYAPFQEYRVRLVKVLDSLLDLLDEDPSYAHFCLDGQTAAADDYLEVRPEAEPRLRRLVAAGRMSMGPWTVLMDEFMVSGETILRNLQLGMDRADELGGVMPVGYLPDMFGHVAQMPQILRLAGLEHAVVWRGVPAALASSGFTWEAPDGSQVRAEYLLGSYSNGRELPSEPSALIARAASYEAELGAARRGGLLLMAGTDHQAPEPWAGRVSEAANRLQQSYLFSVASLSAHLAAEPRDGLPVWRGELRSGARANLLMGVASNRVDVKRAAAAAERAIERRAEPLSALLLAPGAYPSGLLRIAWRQLVLNSAHDSSCACSADEVVDQVMVRYREAFQIGDALARDAVSALAGRFSSPEPSLVVVNPTRTERRGVIETEIRGVGPLHFVAPDGSRLPTQLLELSNRQLFSAVSGPTASDPTASDQTRGGLVDLVRGREIAGRRARSWSLDRSGARDACDLVIEAARPGEEGIDLADLRAALVELFEEGAAIQIRIVEGPLRRAAVATGAVPGFGWSALRPVEGVGPTGAVSVGPRWLANEHLRCDIDPSTGTFSLLAADGPTVSGLNRYVDGGDGGDTYNYSPPFVDRLVDMPQLVVVDAVETGPVRARSRLLATYLLPARAVGDHRSCRSRDADEVAVQVVTTLELRTGEPFLRVRSEIDNRARDHRLRVHFPLPARVSTSSAECAFAVVERALEAEGGPGEAALPTFPARRFVDCSDGSVGLAVISDGLLEYELVNGGAELAVTILRSVGFLSRLEPALRPNPAGPPVPVEGAQMLGRVVREYALVLHRGGWEKAQLATLADAALNPLEIAWSNSSASLPELPPQGAELVVDGAEVSAVGRNPDGALWLRLCRLSGSPGVARVVVGGREAVGWEVDLRGRPGRPFPGAIALRPWEVITLRLERASLG